MSASIYLVYKHTSPSGKSYIGVTSNYDARNAAHIKCDSKCRAFSAAIKKYGWNNFLHEILYNGLTLDQANYREQQCINEYGTLAPTGYNLLSGGHVQQHHTETKRLMSQQRKGKPSPHKGKKKPIRSHLTDNSSHKGQAIWNNGTIEKRCDVCPVGFVKGRLPQPQSVRDKISASRIGTTLSADTKLLISAAQQGTWWNNGLKNKRSIDCPGIGYVRGSLPHKRNRSV